MNRFFIQEGYYLSNLFNSGEVYFICFQNKEEIMTFGEPFNSEIKAQEYCDWMNHADHEVDDFKEAGLLK